MASIIKPDFKHRPRTWRRAKDAAKHSRMSGEIPSWVPWGFVAVLFLTALYLSPSVSRREQANENAGAVHVQVMDGDTVRSNGQIYRLVGFNTPESGWNAQCSGERALAAKATHRLEQLLAEGASNLQRVACACISGTEGTQRCNAGRLCAKLTVDGRDVGSILIAEGLAERYQCWATSCPRRKDWCGS